MQPRLPVPLLVTILRFGWRLLVSYLESCAFASTTEQEGRDVQQQRKETLGAAPGWGTPGTDTGTGTDTVRVVRWHAALAGCSRKTRGYITFYVHTVHIVHEGRLGPAAPLAMSNGRPWE